MNNKFTFKIEAGVTEELIDFTWENFYDYFGNNLRCYLNDCHIGDMLCQIDTDTNYVYIEYWALDKKYRGKGYGVKVLNELKAYLKSWGVNSITGSCKDALIKFYTKAGAVFEKRTKDDKMLINNVFYIDL